MNPFKRYTSVVLRDDQLDRIADAVEERLPWAKYPLDLEAIRRFERAFPLVHAISAPMLLPEEITKIAEQVAELLKQ